MSEKTYGNLRTVLITVLTVIAMSSLSVNAFFVKSKLSDQNITFKEIIEQMRIIKKNDSDMERETSMLKKDISYIIKIVDEMRLDIKEIKKR